MISKEACDYAHSTRRPIFPLVVSEREWLSD